MTKLEWATTGMTTAELTQDRADANQPNMGLKTWKNSPAGKIRKTDVTVAKNYLTQEELSDLNRVVTMYLDYAEDQAKRQQPMTMAQWAGKLDAFLTIIFSFHTVFQSHCVSVTLCFSHTVFRYVVGGASKLFVGFCNVHALLIGCCCASRMLLCQSCSFKAAV